MRAYCQTEDKCLRNFLLEYLQCGNPESVMVGHECCSVCSTYCQCADCNLISLTM